MTAQSATPTAAANERTLGQWPVVFRADGSAAIGLGHLFRCMALAEGLRKAGARHLYLATQELGGSVRSQVEEVGLQVMEIGPQPDMAADLAATVEALWAVKTGHGRSPIVVTDLYGVDGPYLASLKREAHLLLSVDDLGQTEFPSDIVVNQNVYAPELNYRSSTGGATFLLGCQYVLLRPSLWHGWRDRRQPWAGGPLRVLITFGGSDPDNTTCQVLDFLGEVERELRLIVVLGGANPYQEQVQQRAANSRHPGEALVDVRCMAEVMARADVAVTASGSTAYELAYMGVPMLLWPRADNQEPVATALIHQGLAVGFTRCDQPVIAEEFLAAFRELAEHPQRRAALSTRGQALVDGLGVERVVGTLTMRLQPGA